LIYYIHFNPQKHRFVSDFREYPYSSYRSLCSTDATRLKREQVLTWFNGRDGFEKSHREMMDERRIAEFVGTDED